MNEGKLEFRFQLGSGVGLVETSQPLAIGQQHDITLLRYLNDKIQIINYLCHFGFSISAMLTVLSSYLQYYCMM